RWVDTALASWSVTAEKPRHAGLFRMLAGGWPHLLTFIRFANGRDAVSLEWHYLAPARECTGSVY
ncbi:hypothetical protein, partial [Aeromonas jandaei]|uniref:hypothetical protein n=1 Tax=Aeromonas jandaei TaxID=650 RepID=UPI0038B5B31C